MYLSTVHTSPGRSFRLGGVPGTVVTLGIVSMLTDISSEMVTAILPMYLIYGAGVGLAALGAIDALYIGATAVLRVVGGWLADRLGRPKAVATAGYALSTVSRLLLPVAVPVALAIDRAGKGMRTAPRDAMISLAAPPELMGRSFGVHRALDAAGALLGPLVAFGLISLVAGGYDVVFVASFAFGVAGVLVIAHWVPHKPAPERKASFSLREAWRAVPKKPVLSTVLFGLSTAGDMVLFVTLQRQAGLPAQVLPLLPLGTAVTFLLAAAPVGRLADRIGRWRMFAIGHGLLVAAYLIIGLTPGLAIGALVLHGLFYAATDGVLMAYAGPLIPAHARSSGLALLQTAQALARAAGAAVFGLLAATVGPGLPLAAYGGALALLTATALMNRRRA